jgi:hypothetical protein
MFIPRGSIRDTRSAPTAPTARRVRSMGADRGANDGGAFATEYLVEGPGYVASRSRIRKRTDVGWLSN